MTPQRALVHARRGATILVGIAALGGLGGCAAALGSMAPSADVLLPHSVLLKPPPLDRGSYDISIFRQGDGADTAAQPLATMVMSESHVASDGALAVLWRRWGSPANRTDTLVVNRRSLEPVREDYAAHGVRYDYSFDGTTVRGTVQRPHAAPQHVDRRFGEPVFALSEVEPLVRSLTYRAGMTEIVPLFAAVEGSLQHDTLSVLRRETPRHHAPEWIVRFAAPDVTTDYAVDAATHRILDAVTTRRASGVEIRYEYPGYTPASG
jgi:hypothetical protein